MLLPVAWEWHFSFQTSSHIDKTDNVGTVVKRIKLYNELIANVI